MTRNTHHRVAAAHTLQNTTRHHCYGQNILFSSDYPQSSFDDGGSLEMCDTYSFFNFLG